MCRQTANRFEEGGSESPVELRHKRDGTVDRIAEHVRFADGFIEKRIGLMGKPPLQDGEALVFRFDDSATRHIHTMFLRAPIDVIWLERERVTAVETFLPWQFGTRASGDTIVELPAGTADDVLLGDVVWIDEG